ncbi:hypothetical protein [Klebsiella michiganensis]|uniref:hypothetical protein n=1 Tax=Klebsiella michiganensis TaxID=1134687 RepID=UPI0015F933EF|nr:hypothetical protein [Klebsiella michiganensis]HCT5618800.1 hypothetical protein [Klebsiella oxytoca]
MAFPSPAKDYAEATLTITSLCGYDGNCRTLETSAGYAIVDISRRPKQGDQVLIAFCGSTQFAFVRGQALITDDGEAIEGEALNDVEVKGVIRFMINRAGWQKEDDIPIM